ncbi:MULTISPECIES: MarR family transcriptional regulator [unclassified Rhizobium]|jgi:DNA-binding MarR family transcriptional regulator|uniref:MarR family winged helix-turn-helix transcriptional regulator n=1 Tax=unclassified Rhizobium TaxID=2613769 RepID=UPI000369745B|nr:MULTISPECIES: MarR family transcriptional regulator [unclassified Rhizobium]MBD9447132.1 MarR family transcriptional regulator [Rhizobium sp. RHZ01]MBD9450722.1 MarR family transcriptional regulator [Rhizobium sp. RHZ02]
MNESLTNPTETDAETHEPDILRIGQSMTRMRLMTGRRLIGRLAIQSVAPGLELSHLDVLDAVRRAQEAGDVTVGTIAEMMRIDPSRASRIVAEMVGRNILRRKASQADARRIIVVMTPLGQRLLSEIRAQKLAFVSEVVKDWKPEEIEAFGELFEKFISGFESVFEARVKDIADEA